MYISRNTPIKQRLWLRTSLPNEEGCMLWTGTLDNDGYGVFKYKGKMLKAHRVSLILAEGVDNEDMLVAHSCRNRNCVSPTHLRWATPKENTNDRRKDDTLLFGEKNPMATLTLEDAEKIRVMYATGMYRQVDIANMFNVGKSTVGRIVRRTERWNEN